MIETVIHAAREAGRILREGASREIEVHHAGHRDVKLAMDKKAEAVILGILQKAFPHFSVLSEECGRVGPSSEYLWVVDPLDGTMNFSRRVPLWGTSIALLRGDEPVLGVIYDPNLDELFRAEKGKGAFLNDRPVRVSDRSELADSIVAYGFSSKDEYIERGAVAAGRVSRKVGKVRDLGSAVLHLTYVACGRFDAFYEYGIHLWDVAAGTLMIQEAGGRVDQRTHADGAMDYASSNGRIHDELLREIEW